MALTDSSRPALLCELTAWDRVLDSEATIYLVDAKHGTFVTGTADSPANTIFWPLLKASYRASASLLSGLRLFGGQEGEASRQVGLAGGGAARTFGGLSIKLPPPGLDRPTWVDYILTGRYELVGRSATLKLGAGPNIDDGTGQWAYSSFANLHSVLVAEVSWTEDMLKISVREDAEELRKTWERETFSGAGADEGGADLKGSYKPQGRGQVMNAKPVFLGRDEDGKPAYMLHGGTSASIGNPEDELLTIVLYDGGVALTSGTDYSMTSEGVAALEDLPSGDLTADFIVTDSVLDLTRTRAEVIARLGDVEFDTGGWGMVTGSFDTSSLTSTQGVGLYWGTDAVTVQEALQEIISPLGYWYVRRDGTIAVSWLGLPSDASADATIGYADLAAPPELVSIEPAHYLVRLGYARSQFVQGDEQLLGATEDLDRQFVRREWRYLLGEDGDILTAHPRAIAMETQTPGGTSRDGSKGKPTAELVELFNLAKHPWEVWSVRLARPGLWMSLWVGDHVDLDYLKPGADGTTTDPFTFDRSGALLQESGDALLQENGDALLLEAGTTRRFLVAGVDEDWERQNFALTLAAPRVGW